MKATEFKSMKGSSDTQLILFHLYERNNENLSFLFNFFSLFNYDERWKLALEYFLDGNTWMFESNNQF